jgi:hypothetical protein
VIGAATPKKKQPANQKEKPPQKKLPWERIPEKNEAISMATLMLTLCQKRSHWSNQLMKQ